MATIRRYSDPDQVYGVWKTIRTMAEEGIIVDRNRLVKTLNSSYTIPLDVIHILVDGMVADGFLEENHSKSKKTVVFTVPDLSKKNVSKKCFIYVCLTLILIQPQQNKKQEKLYMPNKNHDWYCYECHAGGEVIDCAQCSRAFHLDCLRVNIDFPKIELTEPVPAVIQDTFQQIHGYFYTCFFF